MQMEDEWSPDHLEDEMVLQSQWSWPKVSTLGPAALAFDSITTFCMKCGKAGEWKWFVKV